MRLRIRPPRKAKAKTESRLRLSLGAVGATATATSARCGAVGPAADALPACGAATIDRSRSRPSASLSASTPASVALGSKAWPGLRASESLPGATLSVCSARSSIAPHEAGKNQASRTASGERSEPVRVRTPSPDIAAASAVGLGMRASAAAKSGASAEGEAGPTGRSSLRSPCSGTQIFSQINQLALALIGNDETPAGGVTVTGSKTSSR